MKSNNVINGLELYFQVQKDKGFTILSKEEKTALKGPGKKNKAVKFFRVATSLLLSSFILSGCNTYYLSHEEYQEKEKEFQAVNFNQDYTRLEMFKTAETEEGLIFFSPDAGEMNTVFITYEDARRWKIDNLKPGAKIAGIFDQWELLDAWEVVTNE